MPSACLVCGLGWWTIPYAPNVGVVCETHLPPERRARQQAMTALCHEHAVAMVVALSEGPNAISDSDAPPDTTPPG